MAEGSWWQGWVVVVLETTGMGEGKIWSITVEQAVEGDYGAAVALAERIAWEHRPHHPTTLRDRRVYREDERRWLVSVQGMSRQWPFEVRVVHATPPPDGIRHL